MEATKVLFRPHRGSLADAMAEVCEVSSLEEIFEKSGWSEYGKSGPIEMTPYGYDKRIDWDTWIVCFPNNSGVLGFTNGPLPKWGEKPQPIVFGAVDVDFKPKNWVRLGFVFHMNFFPKKKPRVGMYRFAIYGRFQVAAHFEWNGFQEGSQIEVNLPFLTFQIGLGKRAHGFNIFGIEIIKKG